MRRLVYLPLFMFGVVVAATADCGGAGFDLVDASSDASSQDGAPGGSSGSGGGYGSSSGGGNGSSSSGGASGSTSGGSSGGATSSSGGRSSSGGNSGGGSNGGGGIGGSSGGASGASSGGSSNGGGSGSGGSSSSGSGSGGSSGGHMCLSNGCGAGMACCGTACCMLGQLCCAFSGPVPPVDPYYCYTPTASQPSCPPGCSPKCVSDRNVKRDIEPVDEQAVLEAVSRLPISTWSYRSEDPSVRHLGPMAQDFHAEFGLGDSDRVYDAIDAHGVAFAAIKALRDQLREQSARIERLERENREIEQQATCGR